jgi:hypothetical protein
MSVGDLRGARFRHRPGRRGCPSTETAVARPPRRSRAETRHGRYRCAAILVHGFRQGTQRRASDCARGHECGLDHQAEIAIFWLVAFRGARSEVSPAGNCKYRFPDLCLGDILDLFQIDMREVG